MKILQSLVIAVMLATALRASADGGEVAPLIAPDAGIIRLDEIGLYAVGYQYRGQEEKYFPVGWSGGFDPITGVSLQPLGE